MAFADSAQVVLQVQAVNHLTGIKGIVARFEAQGSGQLAHRGIAGGVDRIHLVETVLARGPDQMCHQ